MTHRKNIDLIIFDMDGTLFTSNVNWKSVKEKLNVKNTTILEKLYNGSDVDKDGLRYLENIEEKSTKVAEPVPGSLDFIDEAKRKGIKTSLVTNNSRRNAEYLLNKFDLSFDMLITRDENMWKPSPDAFKYSMKMFAIIPENTISVGDSDLDISASVNSDISDIYIIRNSNISGKYLNNFRYFTDFHDLSSKIFIS